MINNRFIYKGKVFSENPEQKIFNDYMKQKSKSKKFKLFKRKKKKKEKGI